MSEEGRSILDESRSDRSTNEKQKKGFNLWKWAFLILLGLLIGASIWIFQQLQPVEMGEQNTAPVEQLETDIILEVRTGRAELTRLANTYLEQEMADGFVGFTFELEEQAELHGEIEVFGFPIEFSLFMTPYVLENGNLQLRGDSINIGSLNLPVSFAMAQIGRQVDFPEWIAIDSEEQLIVINLNEFELDNGIRFSMSRIDLAEDDIRVNIHLPEEAIQ